MIVYSSSAQFRITGTTEIKRFAFNQTPFVNLPEIEPGTVNVTKGIYGIYTADAKTAPAIDAISAPVDYHLLVTPDKDIWPEGLPPPDKKIGAVALGPVYSRAHSEFANLRDADLLIFIDGKSSGMVGQGKAIG